MITAGVRLSEKKRSSTGSLHHTQAMVYKGTHDIAGIPVAACDYEFILSETEKHIRQGKMFLVSPLASQTIAKAHTDPDLRQTLHRSIVWSRRILGEEGA
jgi:UDP-N-acetyl-D-mannosaminuronic acid transferase (WecB/TagA/CpsF family)